MFCPHCGREAPSGATNCPACGAGLPWTPPPSSGSAGGSDTLESVLHETRRAAQDLGRATARLSKRLVEKAQVAAKDPSGSAKKAAQRVAKELDEAAHEIDRIIKEL